MELCTGGELFDRILEEAEKHEGQCSAACAMQTVRKERLCREGQKNNMIELISFWKILMYPV